LLADRRIRIQEAQKHVDPVDPDSHPDPDSYPDPQHCRHGTKKEQTIRIPFQTLPRKSKQLGIPFRSTKIEEKASHGRENKSEQNAAAILSHIYPICCGIQ
jgi:hypothetical protein